MAYGDDSRNNKVKGALALAGVVVLGGAIAYFAPKSSPPVAVNSAPAANISVPAPASNTSSNSSNGSASSNSSAGNTAHHAPPAPAHAPAPHRAAH